MTDHPRYADHIDFDEGNESELAAHSISPAEAMQVLTNDPLWARNKKGRAGVWLAVGRTNGGRALTLPVVYIEQTSAIRPITGWDSTKGEQTRYLRG